MQIASGSHYFHRYPQVTLRTVALSRVTTARWRRPGHPSGLQCTSMSYFSPAVSFPFVCCYFSTATRKVEVGRACMRCSDSILGLKVIADVKNLQDLSRAPSRLAYWSVVCGNEMFTFFCRNQTGMIVQPRIPGSGKLIRPNIASFPFSRTLHMGSQTSNETPCT